MHHLILKQPVSCGESRPGPPNHLLGPGSLGLSVTKKAPSHLSTSLIIERTFYTYLPIMRQNDLVLQSSSRVSVRP